MSLDVDDRGITRADELAGWRKGLVEAVRTQKATLDRMSYRDIAAKFTESRYYAFRHWRTATGADPRPPAEVYQRLATWPEFPAPSGGDEAWDMLRDLFDPRSDVGPPKGADV